VTDNFLSIKTYHLVIYSRSSYIGQNIYGLLSWAIAYVTQSKCWISAASCVDIPTSWPKYIAVAHHGRRHTSRAFSNAKFIE